MVNAHFGLRDNPFRLTPDLGVRCDWPSFAAARERLLASLRAGGRALLVGEPGVGKTLLLRSLGQELAPLGAVYVVCGRRFGPDDLARALAGAQPSILLLDDAHHMEREALSDLLHGGGALALGATPGFAAPGLEEIVLPPLTPQEVSDYVHCRLAAAGWTGGELFDAEACERLWRFSEGAARRINNLSSGALFLGSQQQAEKIDAGLIEAAAASLSLQPATAPQPPAAGRRRAAAVPSPVDSPTIMAAFMRDRAGTRQPGPAIPPASPAPPEPARPEPVPPEPVPPEPVLPEPAAQAAPEPIEAAKPPAAPPPAAAPVAASIPPPPAPEPSASLLQAAALRAPLSAPAVPRWTDEAPPPRPMRVANRALLALALVALAGVAVAWRFDWLAKPDLAIDWRQVAEVTSPRQAPPPGSGLAVVIRETAPQSASGSPPIVFPNVEPAREAAAQPESAPPPAAAEPPAAAPAPVVAEQAAAPGPATEPEPSPAASAAREPERPAPAPLASAPAPAPASAPASAPAEPARASPQPQSPQAPPLAPPAVAAAQAVDSPAPPEAGREERIAELLAQARRLALAFALTTPPGQSAIDSYREVLAIAPGRQEALGGFDEIAAKYDDLAGLARLRDKPALVQLYEGRAAQVRQERQRLAASPPAVERPAR